MGFKLTKLEFKKITLIMLLAMITIQTQATEKQNSNITTAAPGLDFIYFAEMKSPPSPKYFIKTFEKCQTEILSTEQQKYICSLAKSKITRWDVLERALDLNQTSDVLFFGERHIDQNIQLEFANLLYFLKSNGFTTLAMEIFPQSTQSDLDLYNQNKLSLDDLIKILDQHWNYNKDGYRIILETAKHLNMKIIGLDDRSNPLKLDFWPEFYDRDTVMAMNLTNEVLNHKNKVVVYSGALHAMKSFGKNSEIKTLSEKFKSKMLENGIKVNTQNFIFRNSEFSRSFKGLMELRREPENKNILVTSDDFLHFVDAIIYTRRKQDTLMAYLH